MANLPPTTLGASLSEAKSFSKPAFPKPISQRTPRRSSSRSIKRKKFDDELVESSLKKSSKRGAEQVVPLGLEKDRKGIHPSAKAGGKRLKKNKPPQVTKDFGRWRPTDDLALITAVQQSGAWHCNHIMSYFKMVAHGVSCKYGHKTNDLTAVFLGVKFSCHFTLRDIEERWYTLLYDPVASRLATTAMKQLPPDIIAAAQNNALWSREEEAKLATVPSNSPASLEIFQEFLTKYPAVFQQYRSAKSLRNHWLLMRQYQLLVDQSVAATDSCVSYSDAEEQIHDTELLQSRDDNLEQELAIADRRQKREIRQLEDEIPKWQAIVDDVCSPGKTSNEFDSQTLAVLRGRLVRYLMRSREITVGRSTADNQVDVDLSLEGPAWKVSRKQAVIRLKGDGEYYILNEGRRPIYIDGKPVTSGIKAKLQHNSTFEICNLRFVFLVNEELASVNKDAAAVQTQSEHPSK